MQEKKEDKFNDNVFFLTNFQFRKSFYNHSIRRKFKLNALYYQINPCKNTSVKLMVVFYKGVIMVS